MSHERILRNLDELLQATLSAHETQRFGPYGSGLRR
jgi:hypothetical protein